jgi:hypothetical protein
MKIKIEVPSYIARLDSVTPRQLVFASVFFNIHKIEKLDWDTSLTFHSLDIRRILGYGGTPESALQELNKQFDIGVLDQYNISVKPKQIGTYKVKCGWHRMMLTVEAETVEVTDHKAIMIWMYLVGRLNAENLVNDSNQILIYNSKQGGWLKTNLMHSIPAALDMRE